MFFVIGSVRPRIVRSLRRSLQLCLMVIMGHSKVKAIATAARRCCHSIASLPLSLVQQQSLTPDKSSSSTQATAAQCTVPSALVSPYPHPHSPMLVSCPQLCSFDVFLPFHSRNTLFVLLYLYVYVYG